MNTSVSLPMFYNISKHELFISHYLKRINWHLFDEQIKLFIITLLFTPSFLAGQINSSKLSHDGNWVIHHYNTENGLTQNSINFISRDINGMFWFATQDGIVRYDGKHFKTFITSKIPIFNQGRIPILYPNENMDSIIVFDGKLTPERKTLIISNGKINATNNTYYAKKYSTNFYGQLINYDYFKLNNIVISNPLYPSIKVKNFIYFFKNKGGLEFLNKDEETWRKINIPEEFKFEKKLIVKDNILLLFDTNLNFIAIKEGKIINTGKIALNAPIKKITSFQVFYLPQSDNNFIRINNDIFKIEISRDNQVNASLFLSNFEDSNINIIFSDEKSQLILIGSSTQGLYILKKRYFKAQNIKDNNEVYCAISPINENEVIGTTQFHMNKASSNTLFASKLKNFKQSKGRVINLWKDNKNRVWANWLNHNSDYMSLGYYNANDFSKFHFINTPISYFENKKRWLGIIGFTQTSDEKIWCCTDYGLGYIKDNNFIQCEKPSWYDKEIGAITHDKSGNIWVGCTNGLHSYSPNTGKYHEIAALKDKQIRYLTYDDENGLWIGTYGQGFFYLKDGKLTAFPLDKGEYLRNSHCFTEDKHGFFWITTNNGIFKVKKTSLIDYVNNKTTPYYFYYSLKGQATNEFNGNASYPIAKLDNGDFAAISINGIIFFTPERMNNELSNYPIIIDKITVGNKDTLTHKNITLSANFERIMIELAQSFYEHADNQRIEYRLKGFDNHWKPYPFDEKISFTQLNAGNYELEVRVIKDFEGNYEYYRLLDVDVKPYWYWSWGAILSYIIAIFFSIALFIYFRIKRIAKRNRELEILVNEKTSALKDSIEQLELSNQSLQASNEIKNKILSVIAHDMKTPLLFMQRVSQNIQKTQQNLPEDLKQYLGHVDLTSSQINQWLSTLIQWVKSNDAEVLYKFDNVNIANIIDEVLSLYQQTTSSKSIQIFNKISPDCEVWGDAQWLRIMFNNLFENSIKFTENGNIYVNSKETSDKIIIEIRDEGKGIDPEICQQILQQQQVISAKGTKGERGIGLGISIVKNVVAEHGGKFNISSELGKGTTVEVILLKPTKRRTHIPSQL